jgi:hypothetical protein
LKEEGGFAAALSFCQDSFEMSRNYNHGKALDASSDDVSDI